MAAAMESTLAVALPRCTHRALRQPILRQSRRSSFIQEVIAQVKKDMEADEKLKKDWDKVQQSTEKMRERSRHVQSVSSSTSARLNELWEQTATNASEARSKVRSAINDNESLRSTRDSLKSGLESGSVRFTAVSSRARSAFTGGVDKMSSVFSYFGEDQAKAARLNEWKAARSSAAAAKAAAEEAAEAEAAGTAEASGAAKPQEPADALVVSQERRSSWDMFGAGLRDMPFLNSVFGNPLFEQLFGESEIAASIREMKETDRSFRLEDFAEDVEHIVAPHIITTYLNGDSEALEKHCGDAAFAAVNASIKARNVQKLTLDTSILAGPKEFELKGAKLMEQGSPCFIWTFNTQQVNCLRNKDGEIIEGAVDDIRTVHYAMAVTRHPNLEELDLEYPWQVSELAILGNQPCW